MLPMGKERAGCAVRSEEQAVLVQKLVGQQELLAERKQ